MEHRLKLWIHCFCATAIMFGTAQPLYAAQKIKKKIAKKEAAPAPQPAQESSVHTKKKIKKQKSVSPAQPQPVPPAELPTPMPSIPEQPTAPATPVTPTAPSKPEPTTPAPAPSTGGDLDFDLGSVPMAEPSTEQAKPSFDTSDFDIEFKEEDTRRKKPVEEVEEVPQEDIGLPFDVPYIGKILLMPFTDPKTNSKGFKAKFADASKKITIGNLVIDDGTIVVVNDKLGITGRATLFNKQATFGLKEAAFASKSTLNRAVLGVTYTDKPTVEILPGKSVTLNETNIVFEKDKPTVIEAVTDLFGHRVTLGFVATTTKLNLYLALPETPLAQLITAVQGTPLDAGMVKEAKVAVNNIWNAGQSQPLQAVVKGHVDLSGTRTQSATAQLDFAAQEQLKNITFDATITRAGISSTIALNNVALPAVGTLYKARVDIDTTKPVGSLMLFGELAFEVPLVGTLPIAVASAITKEGIQFAGTVPTEVSYAGFSLKQFTAAFDTKKKLLSLQGNVIIEGLDLLATLLLVPDKQNPQKRTIAFSGRSKAQELTPFANSGIPGIETFKVTDFDAGVTVETINGKQVTQLDLNGELHFLGRSLKSVVKIVQNEKGEKGVYINAPLTKDKTLSDILPALKGDFFDGLMFKEAAFFVSSIDFRDTQQDVMVKKGLSFLAKVPLTGSLKEVGKFLGSSNQDFTLFGKIMPENPTLSEFGIILTKGTVDPSAKFSLGELSLAISGSGSFSMLTNVIFRPEPQQVYDFTGKIALNNADATANLSAFMDGTWNNPFGLQGWSIANPALEMGILYGSPGIPTEFGGGAHVIISNKLDLSVYFKVDAALKNIAFDGTAVGAVSPLDMIKLVAQAWGIRLINAEFADITLKNLRARYAPKDTLIGSHLIGMGLSAAADMDIFGKTAHLDIHADTGGVSALAELDPLDVGGVLRVTGRGEDKKPKIDIAFPFLQPDKAHFLVTGKFEIPDFYFVESYFKLDKRGIEFNFESNMGGDTFNWNGKPLLRSQATGRSGGNWNNPEFMLEIVFEQHLKKYLIDQVQQGFNNAKDAVNRDLGKAQQEIAKIKEVIKDADTKITAARSLIERSKKNLIAIDNAINESQEAFKKAQLSVDSLKNDISKLDSWYKKLPAA